ncbi:LOW QUALITY PROTEIN: E3 SUMO-protein ligase MMS21-like [Argentina anserina]|uniref:LOW QUALITY PROTEIN: E3 SUMO-protein ligase MMS21-like n=1 Tax=Argentina anserina TaxID=57926 RepID=UPI0021767290|nr:LOW QUALITY PROTEIN: E3 SUMO-protein ligase MMS21-like [Potentilla anserina]
MASTSARTHASAGRIRTAATTFYSDNQSLLGDIRKSFNVLKDVAVDLEKANQVDKVKELESAAVELLATCDHCMHLSSAMESVGENYEPPQEPSQLTDFEKLLKNEVAKEEAKSPSSTVNQSMLRQFREAVWNVHHAGQPMPGDDQEDFVMTSNDGNIRNTTCPLSGKHVTELENSVRSVDCKHIYQRKEIMHYLHIKRGRERCPIAGCPRMLQADKLVSDPLLAVEIQELRDMMKRQTGDTIAIEDFTMLDED